MKRWSTGAATAGLALGAIAIMEVASSGGHGYQATARKELPSAAPMTPQAADADLTVVNATPMPPSTGTPVGSPPEAPSQAREVTELTAWHADRASSHEPTRAEREHALREAREAARDALGDARALQAWAVAAYRAGALREARRAADAWILVESTPEPHILLAEIVEAMGHHGEARAVLAEVLESHPESVQARRLAARLGNPSSAPESAAQKAQVARR